MCPLEARRVVRGLFELNQNFKRTEAGQSVLAYLYGLDCLTAQCSGFCDYEGRALAAHWPTGSLLGFLSLHPAPNQPGFQGHQPQKALPFLQTPEKLLTFDVCDLFCTTYRSPQHNYREDKLGWKSVPFLKPCAHSSSFHTGPGTLWLHESIL